MDRGTDGSASALRLWWNVHKKPRNTQGDDKFDPYCLFIRAKISIFRKVMDFYGWPDSQAELPSIDAPRVDWNDYSLCRHAMRKEYKLAMKMRKLESNDISEINDFIQDHWIECAAQTAANHRLKMLYNGRGQIKVIHGDEEKYLGSDLMRAVKCYNNCIE